MPSSQEFPDVLSSSVRNVSLSPIAKAGQSAARLIGEGRDVITLTAGEPDFDTPDAIKRAAIDAILSGKTKYTPTSGTGALRQAIADHYARRLGLDFSSDGVIVSNGVKQVIYNAFRATLDPDDEVILPSPYWPTFSGSIRLNGGKVVAVPTAREEDFLLTGARLESAITSGTKWLVINSPNNPTGAVYGESRLLELADILRRHPRVLILIDEIYDHITFNPDGSRGLLGVAPDLRARTLIANGVSKTYAMTGWRIGWAVAHARLIKAMEAVQSQVSSGPSSIGQAAALAALSGAADDFLDSSRQAYRERAAFVVDNFNAIDGLSVHPPRGSFFAWIDCSATLGKYRPDGKKLLNDQDVADWILENGVALVPGHAYGQSPFLRLSFAASLNDLRRAHQRIADALSVLEKDAPAESDVA
ncbi:MAG: pyridoxal phosphate-dependent aminotransferase [Pseudochelatococcus sp.]|jgi:aspartate aminotransferase|uniref:pyridoxal phosphate-dependent aminotransferase n=1 Tax=Pseudochelatococcus sp. TaxID=2020869 RepID=UPI003D941A2E